MMNRSRALLTAALLLAQNVPLTAIRQGSDLHGRQVYVNLSQLYSSCSGDQVSKSPAESPASALYKITSRTASTTGTVKKW